MCAACFFWCNIYIKGSLEVETPSCLTDRFVMQHCYWCIHTELVKVSICSFDLLVILSVFRLCCVSFNDAHLISIFHVDDDANEDSAIKSLHLFTSTGLCRSSLLVVFELSSRILIVFSTWPKKKNLFTLLSALPTSQGFVPWRLTSQYFCIDHAGKNIWNTKILLGSLTTWDKYNLLRHPLTAGARRQDGNRMLIDTLWSLYNVLGAALSTVERL